jgi:polyhydroxyalkanoate synthesis repressor PhaR
VTTSNPPRDSAPGGEADAAAASSDAPRADEPRASTGTPRVIKRYSNRKLYDTVESRYVTLPQIAQLVRKGEDVRIIDNNSKEDLTSVTLAQILYEEERKQSRALPLGALKDLIHTSGEKIMTSLREGPVGKLIGVKPPLDGAAEGVPASPEPPATAAEPAPAQPPRDGAASSAPPGRIQGMIEQSRGALEEWQHRVDDRVRKVLESLSPSTQVEKLQAEVRRLTQRLEELEARLVARGKRDESEKE